MSKPTKKKSVVNDAQTLEDYEAEKRAIAREEKKAKKRVKKGPARPGRRPAVEIMEAEGEDKVVAQKIYILASKGFSRKKIRSKLNIKIDMWDLMMRKYADQYPIYKIALERGEKYAIEEVEESLKSRALGYDYEEVTIDDLKGTKTVKKHVPADTRAIMFFLTNKKPDQYKMKRDAEVVVNNNVQDPIDYNKLDSKTLEKIINASNNEQMTKIIQSLPQAEEVDDDDETT